MFNDNDRELFVRGFITAACWADLCWPESEDKELGSNPDQFGIDDLDSESGVKVRQICEQWMNENEELLRQYVEQIEPLPDGTPFERAGHDLWLTSHRHGVGFWDRGLGELGEKLTMATTSISECLMPFISDGVITFD